MNPDQRPFLLDAAACAISAAALTASKPLWELFALPHAFRWPVIVGLAAFAALLLWVARSIETHPNRGAYAVWWNIGWVIVFLAFATRSTTPIGTTLCLIVALADAIMAWWQRHVSGARSRDPVHKTENVNSVRLRKESRRHRF